MSLEQQLYWRVSFGDDPVQGSPIQIGDMPQAGDEL